MSETKTVELTEQELDSLANGSIVEKDGRTFIGDGAFGSGPCSGLWDEMRDGERDGLKWPQFNLHAVRAEDTEDESVTMDEPTSALSDDDAFVEFCDVVAAGELSAWKTMKLYRAAAEALRPLSSDPRE